MAGELGDSLHDLFEYVAAHTAERGPALPADLHLSRMYAGEARIALTVPKQRYDIRRAMLDLILDADREVYIRNWYFLPDREILNALRSQAQNGVSVNVLLSDRTRVPIIDLANGIHGHKLAKSGGSIYRYTGGFMHAKVAWNDHGTVLFGSANLDAKAMKDNFECSLVLRSSEVVKQLRAAFDADTLDSRKQTAACFRRRPLPIQALSYACNLVSPWL
jgi:cardiolipin synthase